MRAKLYARARARACNDRQQLADAANKSAESISQFGSKYWLIQWYADAESLIGRTADRGAVGVVGGQNVWLRKAETTALTKIDELYMKIKATGSAVKIDEERLRARKVIQDASARANDAFVTYWSENSDVVCTKRPDGQFHFDWSPKTKKAKVGE